ncbi:MAG: hypothetical protein LBD30_04935 [Verrucomicrobiales bacterium]|jgi:hypothetical protein|nr:hypothetical protein [Verrucomicrobiales bacterium]
MTDFTYIIWWIGIAFVFVMFWQIAKSLQSIAVTFRKFEEFVKKFEHLNITELPPAPLTATAPASPSAPLAPLPAADSGGIPGELVAVIAAAVDAVISGPHRILSINPVDGQDSTQPTLAWSVEGRRQIFQSHALR